MYTFKSRIRYSEIDSNNKLDLTSLVNYFQDCSTFHSEELDEGILKLQKLNRAWILSNWQIIINNLPSLGDEVIIGTWPYDFKGFFGLRNFILKDTKGNVLAVANSLWVYMDTKTNRPTRFDLDNTNYILEPRFEGIDYSARKIEVPTLWKEDRKILVTKSLIDTNQHVNNANYIKLAMEFLPKSKNIKEIRAEYKKPALLNDVIIPKITTISNKTTVNLTDNDNKTYAVIEFIK